MKRTKIVCTIGPASNLGGLKGLTKKRNECGET